MSDKIKILVCTKGKHCQKRGAEEVLCAFKAERECLGLEDEISVKKSECLGMCDKGPGVYVKGLKLSYKKVSPKDCRDILRTLCAKKSSKGYIPE